MQPREQVTVAWNGEPQESKGAVGGFQISFGGEPTGVAICLLSGVNLWVGYEKEVSDVFRAA